MKTNVSHLILTGAHAVAVFASSSVVILQSSSIPNEQSAFATFPGENGKIAFASERDGNREIYVMNADGSEQTNISNNPTIDYEPSWSPDGTKLAFTRDAGDFGWFEVYVMNADGSEQTRLTNSGPAFDGGPSWSPDGTKIAFSSGRERDSYQEIYVMNADGSEQTRLTNSPFFDHQPDWSSDGTKIVFTSERDYQSRGSEIFVMNADGSEQTNISNNPANEYYPSWSPDGTKIAFTSNRDGNYEIYVMNADGSNPLRLTYNPASDEQPVWSPDGTKIVFDSWRDYESDTSMGSEIYVMNADGSEQTRLTVDPGNDGLPDWGPAIDTQPPADTTAPVITVPDDMTVEATSPDGAQVAFEQEPSAIDDIDGPVDVTCDYDSDDIFPIGETVITCSAEDAAGNTAEETFTVTVQDTTDPDVEITQVVDRRNRVLDEGDTTPTPYIRVTFQATDAVGVEDIECSLDGQGFTSCTSPVVYDRLSRGTHQVTVRATDEAGNIGEDSFLFTIGSPPSSAAAPPGRQ